MDILTMVLIVLALLSVVIAGVVHRAYSRSQDRVQELTAKVSGLDANLEDRENQLNSVTQERDGLRDNANKLTEQVARLEASLKAKEEQLAELGALEERSLNAFKVLSSEIVTDQEKLLRSRTVDSINNLIKPLAERIDALDRARAEDRGALNEQIAALTQAERDLASEANNLSSALVQDHQVRGRWGEMQVERVLQLSGFTRDIHYTVQDIDGQGGRTDFIVYLPEEREIIIDAKVNLRDYIAAESATNEDERTQSLRNHARAVRNQVDDLARKEYPQQRHSAADFVVMAMPDFALPAAVQHDNGDLIGDALQKGVVLVTFSMLMPLLRCVAMSWQQQKVGETAQEIADHGKELYKRLSIFARHLQGVGSSLDQAVRAYDESVGSFDSRLIPQARRFLDLGIEPAAELKGPEVINHSVRSLKDSSLEENPKTEGEHNE